MSAEIMALLAQHMERCDRLMAPLIANGMPLVHAIVAAGDMESAERADVAVRKGEDPLTVRSRVGSYARFDWCVKNLRRTDLIRLLPELWVWSDPDDTDPSYLALWREAYEANGRQPVILGAPLPVQRTFVVYRGQTTDATGIAWTLSRSVAARFALHGGMRVACAGGIVRTTVVPYERILAYFTDRNEMEVIVDMET